jgi:hypothetical protein
LLLPLFSPSQEPHETGKKKIDHADVESHDKGRNDNDHGGLDQFGAARPRDFIELLSCFLDEIADFAEHRFLAFPVLLFAVVYDDGIYYRLRRDLNVAFSDGLAGFGFGFAGNRPHHQP